MYLLFCHSFVFHLTNKHFISFNGSVTYPMNPYVRPLSRWLVGLSVSQGVIGCLKSQVSFPSIPPIWAFSFYLLIYDQDLNWEEVSAESRSSIINLYHLGKYYITIFIGNNKPVQKTWRCETMLRPSYVTLKREEREGEREEVGLWDA